jgi:HTH-type transcriptional regulator/antitoxin HigA
VDDVSLPLLAKSGWFSDEEISRLTAGDIVQRYLKPKHGPLYLKQTLTFGSTPNTNKTNLRLWVARVRELAGTTRSDRGAWRSGTLNVQFLVYVARLSWADSGPRLAKEFLAEKGIALVVLPALPRTKLDGAAMRGEDGAPIIGLTARHDRLDNFWFTLLHELAHAWKHITEADIAITDEDVQEEQDDDVKEAEANNLAREVFIRRSEWKRSEAFLRPSFENVIALADKLHISPAVVAGRLRREKVGYGMLSKLVGYRQVRKWFPDVRWN